MLVCVPVNGNHDLTLESLGSLLETSEKANFLVVDNASEVPFPGHPSQRVRTVRLEENKGFFWPLKIAYQEAVNTKSSVVALCHNDLFVYEQAWDQRVAACFEQDKRLGLVGFCGSDQIDHAGGRGLGTMCFFRGEKGEKQRTAGRRITGLHPSVLLDALFMGFRTQAVPALQEDWEALPLMHFYDKIWPCKMWEGGWRVATLGVECDHKSGGRDGGHYDRASKIWFEQHPEETPEAMRGGETDYGHSMYLMAEKRFLSEWREKNFVPCWVDENYVLHKGAAK